jgi:hypothetical protein
MRQTSVRPYGSFLAHNGGQNAVLRARAGPIQKFCNILKIYDHECDALSGKFMQNWGCTMLRGLYSQAARFRESFKVVEVKSRAQIIQANKVDVEKES